MPVSTALSANIEVGGRRIPLSSQPIDKLARDATAKVDAIKAAATTWLRAGVPLGEVAKRLGHSVETLVSTYVGALEGDEEIANVRIERELSHDA